MNLARIIYPKVDKVEFTLSSYDNTLTFGKGEYHSVCWFNHSSNLSGYYVYEYPDTIEKIE